MLGWELHNIQEAWPVKCWNALHLFSLVPSFERTTSVRTHDLLSLHRYVDRPGERTPPPPSAAAASPQPLPIRNWFDNRRPSNNPTATQPAPSPTPLRAAAAAYEYNATVAAPPAARLGVRDANPAAAETRASMHSDYIAAWRAMSGPPLLGPVAAEVEREGQQPSSRRRFQTAHGNENNGTESDGGGAGRRRSQARSASRGGRPQSSTDARRSSGGLGRDGTGGGHSSGGWRAEGGGGVADVPFSPMSAGGRNHVSGGWGGGGSVISDVPRHWHSTVSGNPANGSVWRSREFPPGHRAHESADEGNGTPRSGSAQRGRRSLSDFLREIEEIVRAQREQQVGGRKKALADDFPSCLCHEIFLQVICDSPAGIRTYPGFG